MALQNRFGDQQAATATAVQPASDLPASNAFSAIRYLRDLITALTATVTAISPSLTALIVNAQYTGDRAQATADDAKSKAMQAAIRARKHDDVQIALKAQVYN